MLSSRCLSSPLLYQEPSLEQVHGEYSVNICWMKYVEYKLYIEWWSGSKLFSLWLSLKVHQRFQIGNIILCDKMNLNHYLSILPFEGLPKKIFNPWL